MGTITGQPVQKLENCGAFLSDMSTSLCRRFEKYKLRACPNDTDVCSGFAQQDLTQLLGICSEPTQNLVCKMEYKNEPSPLCRHTICKVYEFSIGKIANHASENCASQILTLSKKLMEWQPFQCHFYHLTVHMFYIVSRGFFLLFNSANLEAL